MPQFPQRMESYFYCEGQGNNEPEWFLTCKCLPDWRRLKPPRFLFSSKPPGEGSRARNHSGCILDLLFWYMITTGLISRSAWRSAVFHISPPASSLLSRILRVVACFGPIRRSASGTSGNVLRETKHSSANWATGSWWVHHPHLKLIPTTRLHLSAGSESKAFQDECLFAFSSECCQTSVKRNFSNCCLIGTHFFNWYFLL